jgi:predicted Fe-Mo cluster-binding NifX family protein
MGVIVAAAVEPDGSVGHSWGKARSVVVATVEADEVADWRPYEVCWDLLHDEGTSGAHHARVVTFLRTHGVGMVLVDHVGDGMRRMLTSMGVDLCEDIRGDARAAMCAAVRSSSGPVG